MRKRLDFDRPVEKEVLMECMELALQAPSGSNAQGWHFLFVTDPAKRAAFGEIYGNLFNNVYAASDMSAANVHGDDPEMAATQERVMDSAQYLAENMAKAPVFMIPCVAGRVDGGHRRDGERRPGEHLRLHHPCCLVVHAGCQSARPRHLLDHHPSHAGESLRRDPRHSVR